jgi:D-sedoheptulose 7-phosphate isomerase
MKIGDIFLGITTSSNSLHIINALETCQQMAIPSILFTGYNGGRVKDKADYCIVSTGEMASTIQGIHIVFAHTLCECVEKAMFYC